MTIATETAASYFQLAAKAAERGDITQALHYADKAHDLLLRPQVEVEAPGSVIREGMRFDHVGRVLAEKRRLAETGRA